MDRFPDEVIQQIGWYVYRLIDPRNGETFYIGKGKGNRIFEHVKGARELDGEDATDLKLQRIKDINAAGLPVAHVIHRHKIPTSDIAYQIEAALMEAYPGLTNKVGGHSTGDYGCRHVQQIVDEYRLAPFEVDQPIILISIGRSYEDEGKSIYEAARKAWRINPKNTDGFDLVLAHKRGIVIGAFRPLKWLPATPENFPDLVESVPGRYGFIGDEVRDSNFLRRRVPDQYRARGAANPVRLIRPNETPDETD